MKLEPVAVRGVVLLVISKPASGPIVTVTVVVPVAVVSWARARDAVSSRPSARSGKVFRRFFMVLLPF